MTILLGHFANMVEVGTLLPLASGSAPAAKGVLTEMVPPNRKADALQAMTLVESAATLTTMGVFGFIFSSFADVGKSYLTFYCNAVCSPSRRAWCSLWLNDL